MAGAAAMGTVLGQHGLKLPLLQQLGDGSDRETQCRHCGAELEGLLNGMGGPQLVVAQADAETTGITITPAAAATT